MAKKDLSKIKVSTLPNGYSLTVEDQEYMYFNEIDLLAGFMSHVGMREVDYADRGTILSSLMSAMLSEPGFDASTLLVPHNLENILTLYMNWADLERGFGHYD